MKKPITLAALVISVASFAATWNVGPTRTYTMPSQVSGLVANGDSVLIDAGTYNSDVAYWSAHNLVFKGVGGLAHLKSNGLSYGDKAIWVIGGNNATVEYIEFSMCTSTSQNGAGIRQEGLNLTVRNCYFHDNENGILAGTLNPSNILIEYCEFNHNGAGDGFSHNLYINHVDTLIFRYNYSHHCTVGHELKSRANVNYILYNRLSNEAIGDASREIDLPNGGASYVMGNVIEQGPNSQNSGIVGYGLEGLTSTAPHNLYFINNTVVNNRSTGTFVSIQSGADLYKAYNNILAGPGTILNGTAVTLDTSNNLGCTVAAAGFVNAGGYDFHLSNGSPAINGGTNAGMAGAFSLTPTLEYMHPAGNTARAVNGVIDRGAHEFTGGMGIQSLSEDEMRVYPNPNNGEFYVEGDGTSKVEVYNSIGELVKALNCAEKCLINLKASVGFYIVKVTRAGKVITKRIAIEN